MKSNTKSVSATMSAKSLKSGAPAAAGGRGGNPAHKSIYMPSIPSNLGDLNKDPDFNSIGYYGDLLTRLDG